MKQAQESVTTVDDGPGTVNERLTDGGPGPEGQPDTVAERLSGEAEQAKEPVEETEQPKPAKKTAARKS